VGDDYLAWGSCCAEVESGHGEVGRSIVWSFFGESHSFSQLFFTPWLDRRLRSSYSLLFGGTLNMTPRTSCSDFA
jgi:hypothetical protein